MFETYKRQQYAGDVESHLHLKAVDRFYDHLIQLRMPEADNERANVEDLAAPLAQGMRGDNPPPQPRAKRARTLSSNAMHVRTLMGRLAQVFDDAAYKEKNIARAFAALLNGVLASVSGPSCPGDIYCGQEGRGEALHLCVSSKGLRAKDQSLNHQAVDKPDIVCLAGPEPAAYDEFLTVHYEDTSPGAWSSEKGGKT